MKRERYFIQIGEGPSREVTLEEWIKRERQAGFYGGDGKHARTAGFRGGEVHGIMRYMEPDEPYCAACSGHGTDEHDDTCSMAFGAWLDKGRKLGWITDTDADNLRARTTDNKGA